MVDVCYPDGADWTCAFTQAELDEMRANPDTLALMERSDALSWMTLQSLTGYRLSLCPVTIRPCLSRCSVPTWDVAPVMGGPFHPFISGGRWFNGCGCRTDDCSCASLCEVVLPAEVGDIESIWLDGAELDPSAYRVDNGTKLVRTDEGCWPSCQDMNLAPDEEGSFYVLYYPGVAPNDLFKYAAGVLAIEFYNACRGADCRLPNGVTSITRAGINMEITPGMFSNGATGIAEVDAVIRIYNPAGLKSPPRILSPDRPRGRTQSWGV